MVLVAVIIVQLAVLALVWRDTRDSQIRRVPVAIAAPPVVADSLAHEVNTLPGRPFDARISLTPTEAQKAVKDGVVVAALALDLKSARDTLYVASAQGKTLVAAVVDKVRAIEMSSGRTIDVTDLVRARSGDLDLRVTRALVFSWIVVGFVATAMIAFVKGTRSPTRRRHASRLLGLAALSVTAGLAGALAAGPTYGGHVLALWGVGVLTVFTAAATTTALQGLFGVAGLGIATVVFLMLAGPDYIATHSLLLPQPWPTIDLWVPHGAATSAVVSIGYFGAYTVIKPVLILGTWCILAVAVTVLAHRERERL